MKMKKHLMIGAVAAFLAAFISAPPAELIDPPFAAVAEAARKLPAPENFTSSVSGMSVTLKWDEVTGADAYRVFRFNTQTRTYDGINTTAKTGTVISDLPEGTHRLRVAALVKKNGKYAIQKYSESVLVSLPGKEENMADRITVNTQSSIRIDGGDIVIRIDPFRIPNAPHDADIVLITHEHYDHFSPDDIRKVSKPDTVIAAPASMKTLLQSVSITDAILLKPGEKTNIRGIDIKTVRAYNISKTFHPKSNNWLGYIVNVLGNRIYAAGDTDATPEAKAVKCDIALVPVGGSYTMNAKEAANFVNLIKPEVAIPIHYGVIVGSKTDGETFAGLVSKKIKVELK